jgi:hypothetical protein
VVSAGLARLSAIGLAAVALAGACASGPRFRPVRSLAGADGGVSVEVAGVDSRATAPGIAVAAQVSAPEGTRLREAALALPDEKPCEDHDQTAAIIAVDGAPSWQRPVPVAGAHRLTLRFAETFGLQKRLSGPLAIDLAVATDQTGAGGCVRVAVQDEGEKATWTPGSPWMVGVRLDAAPLAFGLRAGRFVGPVVLGIEDSISPTWSTAAAVATANVFENIGLEVSYAGRWALPGGSDAAGTFRNGPRARLFFSVDGPPRFDGRRIVLAGVGVEVARWWATDAQAAATNVVIGLTGWMNVSAY